jgi:hypothetical protein
MYTRNKLLGSRVLAQLPLTSTTHSSRLKLVVIAPGDQFLPKKKKSVQSANHRTGLPMPFVPMESSKT